MTPPPTAGLALRLNAMDRLALVEAGAPFTPFTTSEQPDGRERALANRLVTTALRRQGHLDIVLAELLTRGMPKKSGRFAQALRIALAEILFLPGTADHAAIFLAVEAIKSDRRSRHLTGLANAVLRAAQAGRDRFSRLDPLLALPQDTRLRWTRTFSNAVLAQFADELLATPPLDLTLRTHAPDLIAALGAVPALMDTVRLDRRDARVEDLPGFAQGRFWIQDVAASLPARLFTLGPRAHIADLGAAPGGKTAQLCARDYRVSAIDRDSGRLARLESNMARLGLAPQILLADALDWRPETALDGVLLDAPCSATGTFRRHPEVLWHRTASDIAERAGLQRRMIAHAARLLRPGGELVYCVCSLETAEGEDQAAWIGANLPELVPHPVTPAELAGLEAITEDGHVRTHPGLSTPAGVRGMDGFFIARYRRAG